MSAIKYEVFFHDGTEPLGTFSKDENGRFLFLDDPKGILGHIFCGTNPERTFELLKHSAYYYMVEVTDKPTIKKSEILEKDHPLKFAGQDPRAEQQVKEVGTPKQREIMAKQLSQAVRRTHNPELISEPARDDRAQIAIDGFHSDNSGAHYSVGPAPKSEQFLIVKPHSDIPGGNQKAVTRHEGIHGSLQGVENKHGISQRQAIVNNLLSQLHPEDRKHMENFTEASGYDRSHKQFGEEVLTHLHDVLNDSTTRDQAEEATFRGFANQPRLKAAYKKIQNMAKAEDMSKLFKSSRDFQNLNNLFNRLFPNDFPFKIG